MFCMVFAMCWAHAQNEVSDSLATETQNEKVTSTDLDQLSALMTELNLRLQSAETNPEKEILVPLHGKSKFARSHYIYQTLEISTVVGKDKDQDENDQENQKAGGDGSSQVEPPDVIANLNLGLNIGYSLIFVPGKVQDDKLQLNRLGFAYSTGLIASFDRQDKYGVTCDFLLKLGVETGNQHPLGIGFDALIGTGKTAGSIFDFNDVNENNPEPEQDYYTAWCFKYGAQVWIKTNLFSTNIKNSDLLVFARFVESKNPYNDEILWNQGFVNMWLEEAWQFGVTFRYRF